VSEGKTSKESDVTSENILRIADELVHQVDLTKKMVLVMIVAIIVAIPVSWHVTPLFLGSPYQFRTAGIVTILIALAFLVVGVRQWMTFSKWTERYKAYKELQSKIDAKLDFEKQNPASKDQT
jgi:ABC-type nickel/cobalt efflux system permease component RcnA